MLDCKNLFLADVSLRALGDKNTIILVRHLDNTNTITMVAREGGNIFIAPKKLNVRSFKVIETKMAFNLRCVEHQGDESSVTLMSEGELR